MPQPGPARLGVADGLFLLWKVTATEPLARLQLPGPVEVCAIGFDPRGRCLVAEATAITDEEPAFRIRVWDLQAGKAVFAAEPQPHNHESTKDENTKKKRRNRVWRRLFFVFSSFRLFVFSSFVFS